MSAPAYSPKPGSVAYRAIAILEKMREEDGPRAETTYGALSSELRVSAETIRSCMMPAIEHGIVVARQKGGHERSPMFLRLADGPAVPVAAKPTKAEREESAARAVGEAFAAIFSPLRRQNPAPNATQPLVPTLGGVGLTVGAGEPGIALESGEFIAADKLAPPVWVSPAPQVVPDLMDTSTWPTPAVTQARCALWSDGTLEFVRANGGRVTLQRDELRVLVDFLDSVARESIGGAAA